MPIILRNYQIELKQQIYEAWKEGHKNILAVKPTGMGKCLSKDTPVLMYDGSIKMSQNIKTGELLMGSDSKPREVLSSCRGNSPMFRINPVKGDSWVCNDVHMLTLIHSETGAITDIPLDEYLVQNKTFKHLHKQIRVAVEFPKKVPWIDPYLVGLYLAEGTHSSPQITNPEPEILEYLQSWCEKNQMKIKNNRKANHNEILFSDLKSGWDKNKIRKLAQSCTNRDDRWIPKEFLINAREIRLQVLAGLLDGDGYLSSNGFEIITKYSSLNRDILFLARSLGFAAYSKKKIGTIKSIDFKGEYFRIMICGHTDQIPNIVFRKKAKPRQQIKDVLRTGFDVEPIGDGEYFGFELTGDGRFLLGDFTVTHNTKMFCSLTIDMAILASQKYPTAIVVHRKELVQQISLTLAEEEIQHNIIAPRPVILGIIAAHRRLLKKQYYDYGSLVTVVSVDTLNARINQHEKWAKSIRLWITDEAAHLLKNNKWGRAVEFFPNAIGLGVTATPKRLDKRGLGRHADGVFDKMVLGPSTRWGIDNGFLCKYKIAIPASDYNRYLKKASEGSDYSMQAMASASEKSHIIGDMVENYLKFGKEKQAIYFVTDVMTGRKTEKKFLDAGISAKLLTAENSDKERLDAIIDYRDKKIKVLINIDLFDEGFDVPNIEIVGLGRPTKSLSKYLQMVGRGLRPAPGKSHLIIIDHVGNVTEHGLPDSPKNWTLDRIVKRRDKTNFIRICSNTECNSPYDRTLSECPWCGEPAFKPDNASGGGRPGPKEVDGDLFLLDSDTLRSLEEQSVLEDPAVIAKRVGLVAGRDAATRAAKNQLERIAMQKELVNTIAKWAGKQRSRGYSDRQIHKHFFLLYDMTISAALAQPRADMDDLKTKLIGDVNGD